MLDDILEFAASTLIDYARLSLWMPTANDEEVELRVPIHHCLDVISVCVQPFNKCKLLWVSHGHQVTRRYSYILCPGSRRLLTYQRIPDLEIKDRSRPKTRTAAEGSKADDLNAFRKRVGAPKCCLPYRATELIVYTVFPGLQNARRARKMFINNPRSFSPYMLLFCFHVQT